MYENRICVKMYDRDYLNELNMEMTDLMDRKAAMKLVRHMEKGTFYVYGLWRQDKGPKPIPFYVGKGCGSRILQHAALYERNRNDIKDRIIKKLNDLGSEILYCIFETMPTNSEACDKEIRLIAKIGRRNKGFGPLANLTDGGDGTTGYDRPKGAESPKARSVFAGGVRYLTLGDAAKASGTTAANIIQRITSGWPGFYYEDEGQRSDTRLGGAYNRAMVIVDGVEYKSIQAAADAHGIENSLARSRLKSQGFPNWIRPGHKKKEYGRKDIRCWIDGVEYASIQAGARAAGVVPTIFYQRSVSPNFPGWIIDGVDKIPLKHQPRVSVEVNGVIYPTIAAAKIATGHSYQTLKSRCSNDDFPNYRFVS